MYSSQELLLIALDAPIHTIEEDIEAMCQRDVTGVQLQFQKDLAYLQSDEFYERYATEFPMASSDHYMKQVEVAEKFLVDKKRQEIDALLALRDYRVGEYHKS